GNRALEEAIDRTAGRESLFELIEHQELRDGAPRRLGKEIVAAGHEGQVGAVREPGTIKEVIQDQRRRTRLILSIGAADLKHARRIVVWGVLGGLQSDRVVDFDVGNWRFTRHHPLDGRITDQGVGCGRLVWQGRVAAIEFNALEEANEWILGNPWN